ncbi:virB8 family protein [Phenylobacterium sp. VNQ135]|uniref:virB8 family protein n=1 Tax=Phenylobacterium sp. VNQ135 TaxID=3400922 RepID=UPI003C04E880
MNGPGADKAARERYYKEAGSWAADIHGSLRASRKLAWIVAAAAVAIAALEAVALAALAPLKTVVPYTISVDRQTGYVETVQPLAKGPLTQDLAVTQANLAQYVLARETFDATDLRDAYRKVLVQSAGSARADYVRLMQKSTPESPLNVNGPTTVVSTTIKSISLLSPTTALVRFDTVRSEAGGPPAPPEAWASVIAFRYSNAPARMGERLANPLGFQVTRYRRDAETAPGAAAAMADLPL